MAVSRRTVSRRTESRSTSEGGAPHPILAVFFLAVAAASLVYAVGSAARGAYGGVVIGLGLFLFSALTTLADRRKSQARQRSPAGPVRALFAILAGAAIAVTTLAAIENHPEGFWVGIVTATIFVSLAVGLKNERTRAPMPQVFEDQPAMDDAGAPPPHVIHEARPQDRPGAEP